MHVLLMLLAALGLAALVFAGLWPIIRHAVDDTPYALPAAPDAQVWAAAEQREDSTSGMSGESG